jgi:hypothetical protein
VRGCVSVRVRERKRVCEGESVWENVCERVCENLCE